MSILPKTQRGELAKARLDLADAREVRDELQKTVRELRSDKAFLERDLHRHIRLRRHLARTLHALVNALEEALAGTTAEYLHWRDAGDFDEYLNEAAAAIQDSKDADEE